MEDDPPMDVPDTVPSERWVPYRNPEAQERSDPSGNKREDKSSAEGTTTSSAGAVDNSSSQADETAHPKPAKRQCLRRSSRTRREPTVNNKESSDEEDLIASNKEEDEEDLMTSGKEEDNLESDDDENVTTRKKRGGARYNHAVWEEKFQLLIEYKNEHGTTRVPKSHPALGTWVMDQRARYKRGYLIQYRRERLNSIGFEWNVLTMSWMEMYNQLLCYKRQHNGSTNVPKVFVENKALGRWVQHQREMYSKKKLPQDRIELLESIGFIWDTHHAHWMEMYKKLVAYEKKYGSTCVPQRWKEDPKLGRWVNTQRQAYSKSKLTQEQIDRLVEIQRQAFLKTKLSQEQIDRLVKRQRQSYSKSKLSQERIDLLESIGFEWDASRMIGRPKRINVPKLNK